MWDKLQKFWKTPKGILTNILAIFSVISAASPDVKPGGITNLLMAAALAGLIDAVIIRIRKKVWEYPSGAVLTAMIVAMVLRTKERGWVVAATSVIAVLSKY